MPPEKDPALDPQSGEYDLVQPVSPHEMTAAARHERALRATIDLVSVTAAKTGRQPAAAAAEAVAVELPAIALEKPASRFTTVSEDEHRRIEARASRRILGAYCKPRCSSRPEFCWPPARIG